MTRPAVVPANAVARGPITFAFVQRWGFHRMTVEAAPDRPSYFGVLRRTQGLAPILMMIVFVMSGNTLVAPILSLYAQSFQVTSTLVGALITLFGIGRLCANIPAGIAGQRFGLRPVLVLGPPGHRGRLHRRRHGHRFHGAAGLAFRPGPGVGHPT